MVLRFSSLLWIVFSFVLSWIGGKKRMAIQVGLRVDSKKRNSYLFVPLEIIKCSLHRYSYSILIAKPEVA